MPGMPVEAFVKTQDRTVISFLVKPLSDQIARAFREVVGVKQIQGRAAPSAGRTGCRHTRPVNLPTFSCIVPRLGSRDETVGMKIDCLMGTYGRYGLACEALACFLQQTQISQATLLIYNQHPVPLHFDHPRVRIVNEVPPAGSLRYIRQRMHELADPSADLIHWWDDDDLYLPWHLDDCLTHIGDSVAWKPASSGCRLATSNFLATRIDLKALGYCGPTI